MSIGNKKMYLQGIPVELQTKLSSYSISHDEEDPKGHRQPRRILTNQEILEELAKQKVIQHNLIEIGKNSRIEEESFTPSSINTKSKKTLSIKKGFGTSSERFPESKLEISSPFAYFTPELRPIQNFNQKGYGNGFVSKSLRFSRPLYNNHGPGPGAYFGSIKENWKHQNLVLDNPISYQHPRIRKRPIVRPVNKKDNFPGPGAYEINENLVKKNSPSYRSVFHSSSTRNVLPTLDREELELSHEQFQVVKSLETKKFEKKKSESSFFANPVIVNRPNHFYEPLINQVVHKTNADITHLYSELKSCSPERENLRSDGYLQTSPIKRPTKIKQENKQKVVEIPKEPDNNNKLFGSNIKVPRIHS
jgi:hypothetical protein